MRVAVVEHQTVRPFELVRQAVAAGHEVTFVTCDLDLYLKGSAVADTDLRLAARVVTPSSTADPARLVEALAPVAAASGLDAVITVSEQHTLAVAEAGARLGLPHTALDAVRLTRDKFGARRRLARAGIPQPGYRLAATVQEAVAAARDLRCPVVVKPVDGSASVNVGVAEDLAQAAEYAEKILAVDGYGRSAPAARRVLIEEYMSGPVVSCETLSADGHHLVLGITDRELTALPHQVELGGCFPAPVAEAEQVAAVCRAALDAIGFDLGAAHTELVLTPDGPRIVEINGRLAGGLMPFVFGAALGRSLYADLVDVITTRTLPRLAPTGLVAGIRSLVAERGGRLAAIEPSPLRERPGVVDYEIRRKVGDHVHPPRNNRDRCGSVITLAPTAREARALAHEVAATTRLVITPAAPGQTPSADPSTTSSTVRN